MKILVLFALATALALPAVAQPRPPVRPTPPAPVVVPDIPTTPPAPATFPPPAIPPPPSVPTRPPPPPPPVRVAPDAPGVTVPLPDGLRMTFGTDRVELNPTTERALRALVHTAPADARFSLVASATGKDDDNSVIRRLSLSRGLNVRAVLINEGVAASRILLRALAATPADDAPDRVDVVVQPAPTKTGG